MIVQINADGVVVGILSVWSGDAPQGYRIVEVPDDWRVTIESDGGASVQNGKLVSLPAASTPVADPSIADFTAQLQLALARMGDIASNGGSYSAGQVRDAVVDEARVLSRVLRFLSVKLNGH